MSLIKFLLFRSKQTSVLGARKYGVKEQSVPQDTSVLASKQYGSIASQKHIKQEEQLLKK